MGETAAMAAAGGNIAKARGTRPLARDTSLSRENLYKHVSIVPLFRIPCSTHIEHLFTAPADSSR
ncbi:hypothetical protein [Alcaligenes aquatilis]|uniref:hypothetical protein n=1 Tax=Alcaligenes aquatilis TaxID=323284 RepID=UPI0036202CE4